MSTILVGLNNEIYNYGLEEINMRLTISTIAMSISLVFLVSHHAAAQTTLAECTEDARFQKGEDDNNCMMGYPTSSINTFRGSLNTNDNTAWTDRCYAASAEQLSAVEKKCMEDNGLSN